MSILKLIINNLIIFFLINTVNIVLTSEWESTHFLWNFGLIQTCNKGVNKNPYKLFSCNFKFDEQTYKNIKNNDIVWVKCCFIQEFCEHILPKLTVPIILLIADGDESFPSNCTINSTINNNFDIKVLLNNSLIIHIFAQNNDYAGPSNKVTSIPIGMDFHTLAYTKQRKDWGEKNSPQKQELQLINLLKTLTPTNQRKKRAYVDFQLNDSMHGSFNRYLEFGENRTMIFDTLLDTGLIDYGPPIGRYELWKKKGEYAFSISPHGNGLDCHRTWEDLILGTIVIVKTSPLDSLYQELPVVIVNEWSEITQENLDKWLLKYGDAFTNKNYREKLTNAYWLNVIRKKMDPLSPQDGDLSRK